jgi:hypothetical protein
MTERDETMTLEKAIKMLEVEYERAKKMDYVRNPIAYALHQVWKMADCDSEPAGLNKAPNDGRERCTVCGTPASLFFVGGNIVGARYCPSCYNKKMGYRGGSGI